IVHSRWSCQMALNLDGLPRDAEQFGVYLSELSDDHLLRLESALKEHVTTVKKENESRPPEEGVERLKTLSMQIGMLRAEKNRREEMAAQTAAQAAAEQYKKAMADLEAIVSGKSADAVEAPAENPEVSAAVAGMANVFANAIQQAVERLARSEERRVGTGRCHRGWAASKIRQASATRG